MRLSEGIHHDEPLCVNQVEPPINNPSASKHLVPFPLGANWVLTIKARCGQQKLGWEMATGRAREWVKQVGANVEVLGIIVRQDVVKT